MLSFSHQNAITVGVPGKQHLVTPIKDAVVSTTFDCGDVFIHKEKKYIKIKHVLFLTRIWVMFIGSMKSFHYKACKKLH